MLEPASNKPEEHLQAETRVVFRRDSSIHGEGESANVNTTAEADVDFDKFLEATCDANAIGKIVHVFLHESSAEQPKTSTKLTGNADVVVGTLFTIDPQTELIYIVDGRTESTKTTTVDPLREIGTRDVQMGISIVHFKDVVAMHMLKCPSLSLSFQCPSPSDNRELSTEDETARNLARRDEVVNRLEQMRIGHSVDSQGSIHVLNGILHIHPPYRSTDCVSKNEIVLQRVSQLLSTN